MIERLGIIGDLHGEHWRLATVLSWFAAQNIDALICTGDIADGRGCINRSCDLLREAEVLTVAGNHDRWLLQNRVRHIEDAHLREELSTENLAFLAELPRWRHLETLSGSLLLCHGIEDNDLAKVWPGRAPVEIERNAELDELIERDQYSFLINGHTHFRVLIDFENLLLMNAGTLKGDHAGVSIMDFREDSVTSFSASRHTAPARLIEHDLAPGARRIWRDTSAFDGSWEPVTLYGR